MYKWHIDTFHSLHQKRARLAHAILLQAPEGTGVFEFSLEWAQALLCESVQEEAPACGQCLACGWFAAGNHPDFRLVQPDSYVQEAESAEDDPPLTARERDKKSDQIRIDQVRELQPFLNVGTHRAGRRVVLLHPADSMNPATQNALLKNLEEPALGTVFILATTHAHRLLPTVRSRCQVVGLSHPAPLEALQWLREQGVQQAEAMLAMAGGAPLLAAVLADRADFLNQLAEQLANRRMDALAVAAMCQRAAPVEVVTALYRWCYDMLSSRISGRVRYHADRAAAVDALAAQCSPRLIAGYLRRLARARALAEHPLNPRLFMEDLLFGYVAMLDGRRLSGDYP
ncbi:MAG: DNA polymerase III subunit delta' [Betaproteobacteria bacterium RIFCSPLOWO2_02_FULL_62_17]|nr:MAG: DNA polymerase III subunit delta' [Betaproteobacteria bacterium RIFCSPLOWO2_02_FULL_62_17]